MRFCFLTILFALSNLSAACFPESYVQDLWNVFKSKYNKTYSNDEDYYRRATFNITLNNVTAHNIEADLGFHSYTQAVNIFADMSLEEMVNKCNGLPRSSLRIRVIRSGTENQLAEAVATLGPLVVSISGENREFYNYREGIYDVPDCGKTPTHAVLVVGFGSENGIDFWRIKNGCGTDWGENGYFRLRRGVNMCGIATGFNIQTQIELLPGLLI